MNSWITCWEEKRPAQLDPIRSMCLPFLFGFVFLIGARRVALDGQVRLQSTISGETASLIWICLQCQRTGRLLKDNAVPGQPIAGAPHAPIDGKVSEPRRRRAIAGGPSQGTSASPAAQRSSPRMAFQISAHIGRSVRHHLDCGCPCPSPVQLDLVPRAIRRADSSAPTVSFRHGVRSETRTPRRLGGDDERTSK